MESDTFQGLIVLGGHCVRNRSALGSDVQSSFQGGRDWKNTSAGDAADNGFQYV